MKLQILVVTALVCCGAASAFTTFIQAGATAARGALHTGGSVANIGLGTANSFGSPIPGVSSAVLLAQSGTNIASSMGNSGLMMVDGVTGMANLMHSMMTNPWVIWIMGIFSRMMAAIN